jgi:VWFA-related protein
MKRVCLPRAWLSLTFFALLTCLAAQNTSSPTVDSAKPEQKSNTAAPFLRSTANLVIVDVVVTHDGHPVKGLQREAFGVLEDGHEQSIKSFEEHGPVVEEANAERLPAPPPNTYTNVPETTGDAINVLLLDAVNTPFADQAYARKKIIEYLKTIPTGTRMAVFTLASRLRLVQGFTTDSAVLLAALNRTAPMSSPVPQPDSGETAAARSFVIAPGPDMSTQMEMASMVASLHQFEVDEAASMIDRRVQITLDALKGLALYLGALPGRKNVIWFSASFPLGLTPNSPLETFGAARSYAPQLQQVSELLTASRVAVYPIDARGLITRGGSAGMGRPTAIAIGSGRTGVIDPGAFPSVSQEARDREQAELATMLQLAEQTGGTAFYNSNASKQALSRAVENGSSYYTLTYSPGEKKFDGSFRKIQVRLAGRGYELAYRHGYYATAPRSNANALLGWDSSGLRPDAPPSAQIFFRARVLAAGDPEAKDLQPKPGPAGDFAAKLKPPFRRTWVEYTADMRQVNATMDAKGIYHSVIEFIVIAYDPAGRMINSTRRGFKLDMPPAVYDELLKTGYSVRNELDLPDGDVWLRLAVHDVSADRLGAMEVPVKIVAKKGE